MSEKTSYAVTAKHFLVSFVLTFILNSFLLTPAMAGEFQIRVDQARLLTLPLESANIIIGNPSIADVSVNSAKLLVITGKSFGHTNMIVLDAQKNVIFETNLVVVNDESRVASIYKGSKKTSYNCASICQSTLVIGDDPEYFERVSKTVSGKFTVAGEATGKPQEAQ